jgi:hypothetical protein
MTESAANERVMGPTSEELLRFAVCHVITVDTTSIWRLLASNGKMDPARFSLEHAAFPKPGQPLGLFAGA